MKHIIKGFLLYETESWVRANERVFFQACKPWEGQTAALIGPHAFEVEVPNDFDPRPQQIAALNAEKKKIQAEFSARCMQIEREISNLLALEAA